MDKILLIIKQILKKIKNLKNKSKLPYFFNFLSYYYIY